MQSRFDLAPTAAGDEAAWLGISAAIYVPTAVASIGWVGWRSGADVLWDRAWGSDPWLWGPVGLALGAALALGSQRVTARSDRFSQMSDALAAQLGPLSPAATGVLAVLSSVGEEWLFRGVLQPAWGWLLATLVFAIVHLPMQRELWLWPFLAFGIGLLLAWLYELSGGLVGPIALHFAINALNLRWLSRRAAEIKRPRSSLA